MNALRNLLCFVTALVFATFALPGIGVTPNKHYRLDMVVGAPNNAQQGSIVTATITNDNPSGSSAQIGSFRVSVANNVSGITIVGATAADESLGFGGVVTFSASSVTVTSIGPLKPGDHYTVKILVNGCGDGNTWKADVWSGSKASGGVYVDSGTGNETTNVPCGVVACNDPLGGSAVSTILGSGSMRGPFNQNGSCGGTVSYFVTNLLSQPDGYLHVRWDSQPDAAFRYVVDPPLTPPLKFGWETDADGNPIFVSAQACYGGSNAQTPAPLGTLISDGGGKILRVSASAALPPVPFPIVLGPKPVEEYLTVTKVNGQNWTVTRGLNPSAHAAGIPVMSTPKVLLQSPVTCYDSADQQIACPPGKYVAGTPAQMCHVFPSPDSRTHIFDIGDGYVRGSF